MKISRVFAKTPFLLLILTSLVSVSYGTAVVTDDPKPEVLTAKHLDSIATVEKRGQLKSLMLVGNATVSMLRSPGFSEAWSFNGRAAVLSESNRLFFGSKYNSTQYPTDEVVFDSKDVGVAFLTPGNRSVFGGFLMSNRFIISDGLLGGVLSRNWIFYDLEGRKAKLKVGGGKKIDGSETYAVSVNSKGGSSLSVKMYFDSQTFRHVRTEYRREAPPPLSTDPSQSVSQVPTVYTLTEDFGSFKETSGVTLPQSYKVRLLITGKQTTEWEWKYDFNEVTFNQKFDDATFVTN